MKAKSALLATIGTLGIASGASADSASASFNGAIPNGGGTVYATSTITLPAVLSIDSITLQIAHTAGSELDFFVNSPDVGTFDFDLIYFEPPAGFDLGVAPGDGSLGNVGDYTFVGFGPDNFVGPHSPPGTYNANQWTSVPQAAGDYVLNFQDLFANADNGSFGSWTINYTPVPAPGALALLGLAGIVGARRRRG